MNTGDWQNMRVSACRTYHLNRDGHALYPARYDEVLPFHAPGLAPARLGGVGGAAFHILPNGKPAYTQRFARTFGFYENLAAVDGGHGWFHIQPDGAPAYAERYAWCGNFQGDRCVVCDNRRYYHIGADGRAAYRQTYAYVGDFREGCAVVTDADRRCGHILADGTPAHPHRYRNLGVYHKGYACAEDANGWMHIDRAGLPIYQPRYAVVEAFYNGRALARAFDHNTALINELGEAVAIINSSTTPAAQTSVSARYRHFHALSADMVGYWKTFAIAAAVKLDLPRQLPITATALASRFKEAAGNMELLLRALAQMGITAQVADAHDDDRANGVWQLTAKGELLLQTSDYSLADTALVWEEFAAAGVGAWVDALGGNNGDFFAQISADSAKVKRTQNMLAAYAKNDYEFLADILPLQNVRHLVDAGGGGGTVARMIARKWQHLNITVLDRAGVAMRVDECENAAARITKLDRDIFSEWQITADAVLLARVLHDWNDQKAARILANANRALPLGGQLFVVEAGGATPDAINQIPDALVSLHLLTVGGGKERSRQQYQTLLAANGFSLVECRYLNPSASVLIGEKIS